MIWNGDLTVGRYSPVPASCLFIKYGFVYFDLPSFLAFRDDAKWKKAESPEFCRTLARVCGMIKT